MTTGLPSRDMPSSQELLNLVGGYRYGKAGTLAPQARLILNPNQQSLRITGFFNHDQSGPKAAGECSELANAAAKTLSARYPNLGIAVAIGNDPIHFKSGLGFHHFLIVQQDSFAALKYEEKKPEKIAELISSDARILDPSFHRAVAFSESGYSVALLRPWKATRYIGMGTDLLLGQGDSVPIGVAKDGSIYLLGLNFHAADPVHVIRSDPDGNIAEALPLDSALLDGRLTNEPEIAQIVRELRSLPREEQNWVDPFEMPL